MSTQLGERQARAADEGGWRLRNWRVRARLVSLILIPTAAAVLLGGVQMFASTGAASDYERTNQLARLSDQISELTHQVARERAVAAWFIARGRPDNGVETLTQQVRETSGAASTVKSSAEDLSGEVAGRTADELEATLARLDDLTGLREQTSKGDLLPGPSIELYTTVISDLISVHDELSKGTDDDELFRQSQLLVALARAKEAVSRQQAWITIALQAGRFEQEQLKAVFGEQARETNERRAFTAEATADERRVFDENVNAAGTERMLFLRELVLSRAANNQPLKGLDLAKRDDAREWYEAASVMVDSMRAVERRQSAGIVTRSEQLTSAERQRAYLIAGAVLALLIAVLLITTGVARSLVRPLRRLRGEALEIAGRRLPEFVQRLRESRDGGADVEIPPIGIFSKDEVGEVARAFDEVHREAVRLAGDEARLRSNVNAMFVNLSRRSQTLVERQLTLIERLERGERDDTRLGDLFKLDHLATRMRRNSENLLVLAGQEAARKWSEAVELLDIVRAALGEVESYDRVSIQVQSAAAIAGQAVSDVVHLLAELVENAVSFSSRDTKVIINSSRIDGGGLMVSVTDQGIGMTPEELAQANWRLANPPVVDVSVSRRMGLFVVGRLALRHNIRVQLRRQDIGGLTAMVLIPEALLSAVTEQVPEPGGQAFDSFDVAPAAAGAPFDSFDAPAAPPFDTGPSPFETGSPFDTGPSPFDPAASPFAGGTLGGSAQPAGNPPMGGPPVSSLLPRSHGTGPHSTPHAGGPPGGPPAGGPPSFDATPSHTPSYDSGPPSYDARPQHPSLDVPLPESEPRSWFSAATPSIEMTSPIPKVDEYLPIFAAVENESSWFTKSSPTPDQRTDWQSPADSAWQAARSTGEPEHGGTTSSGLPKRTPRANLVPGSATPAAPPPPPPPVEPDRLRSRLSSYQQGVRKGRSELEENP
ncbi:nitrate- and nitrite sensing domain-containing protein [Nonomuraea sp. NPDC050540]|uniref:nitrate- and nitrite sensing domain-containing protein n=1 Tax=Nonomuraea sp. NPDC050540 TaxID=3364367 RepID=UPI00378C4168